MVIGPKTVTNKKLLVVEGNDDVNFFEKILINEGISNFQIEPLGGIPKFYKELKVLKSLPGFSSLDKFAIIRDADNNAGSSFQSIVDTLKEINLEPPNTINTFSNGKPNVGIFIICKPNSNSGMLEDLCLETVKNTPAMKCVEIFLECVLKLKTPPKNVSKSMCQAYRAAMPESVPHTGLAAKKGYFNLDSSKLDELKNFLKNFE